MPYLIEFVKIMGFLAAYMLIMFLTELIHPLLPGLVVMACVVGGLSYIFGKWQIEEREHRRAQAELEDTLAASRAQLEQTLASLRRE